MKPTPRPPWRDFLATEKLDDGTVRPLGAFHAKVGHAFEMASHLWPEPFLAGRGRIEADEKPGAVGCGRAALERAVTRAPDGGIDSTSIAQIAGGAR